MKFEDRSPGGTARQERCVRGDAWRLAKNLLKLKETDKATFFSPTNDKLKKEDKAIFYSHSEEWIMLAASAINPEEREFVVDFGANMHMVSKKDLNKAELESVRISQNPTVVMTASGEVPAKEEATVYVRELDLFVTVKLLENTPAVLSLGKLCEEFGYSYHWTSGQEPHPIKTGKTFHCDTSNHVPFVETGLSTSPSTSSTSPTSSSQETVTDTEIPATSWSEESSEDSSARGNSWHESTEDENPNKDDDEESQSGELQGVPDWLQEFKDGLVDESVPEHRDVSSSSHEDNFGAASKSGTE